MNKKKRKKLDKKLRKLAKKYPAYVEYNSIRPTTPREVTFRNSPQAQGNGR